MKNEYITYTLTSEVIDQLKQGHASLNVAVIAAVGQLVAQNKTISRDKVASVIREKSGVTVGNAILSVCVKLTKANKEKLFIATEMANKKADENKKLADKRKKAKDAKEQKELEQAQQIVRLSQLTEREKLEKAIGDMVVKGVELKEQLDKILKAMDENELEITRLENLLVEMDAEAAEAAEAADAAEAAEAADAE